MPLIQEYVYFSPSELFPYKCHHGAGMSEVEAIILSQKYQFFLPMLGSRDRNELWHQIKRHEIYNYRFSKLIVENEEEERE